MLPLRRLHRHREAAAAYRHAFDLADNEAERAFLAGRLAEIADRWPALDDVLRPEDAAL